MHDSPNRDEVLETRLVAALESVPQVRISADFAARISHLALEQAPASPLPRFGMWALWGALALLMLAMLLFAPWAASRSTVPVTLELLLAAEFVGLACWLSLRPRLAR